MINYLQLSKNIHTGSGALAPQKRQGSDALASPNEIRNTHRYLNAN